MSLHGICGIMDTNLQYTIQNRARTSSIRYAIFNTHRLPRSKQRLIYAPNQRLTQQLKDLSIPFTDDFGSAIKDTDHIVDAIFGKPTPLHRTTVSRNAVTLALSGVKRVIATPETLNPPKLISIFAHYFTNKTKLKQASPSQAKSASLSPPSSPRCVMPASPYCPSTPLHRGTSRPARRPTGRVRASIQSP